MNHLKHVFLLLTAKKKKREINKENVFFFIVFTSVKVREDRWNQCWLLRCPMQLKRRCEINNLHEIDTLFVRLFGLMGAPTDIFLVGRLIWIRSSIQHVFNEISLNEKCCFETTRR